MKQVFWNAEEECWESKEEWNVRIKTYAEVGKLKMMEWVSVKDRLPPYGPCIVFCQEHDPQVYLDAYGEVSEGKAVFCHELLFNTKVTHWMLLPSPP